MTTTMTKVDTVPAWIQAFSDEIDVLAFGPGFEWIDENTEWSFGVRTGRGPDELKAFFHEIDDRLDTTHRLLECWSGAEQHLIRGEADVKPKGNNVAPIIVPFVWIFYMDPARADRLRRIYIVNGPVKTESIL